MTQATIKIWTDTLTRLRELHFMTRKSMVEILDALVTAEYNRLTAEHAREGKGK